MTPFITIAERVALLSGKIQMRKSSHIPSLEVQAKSENNFVTEVDLDCEREIIYNLQRAYPAHAIMSEESGLVGDENAEYRWIVDPLDGTTNFLHGMPHYATSIALMKKNEIIAGVIYDPNRNELFSAAKGEGATLNQRKIRVSSQKTLEGSLLGTGIPYQHQDNVQHHLKLLGKLIEGTAGIRRAGAASLDLAYVASGRLDGFWEFGLSIWDIAAGALLVQEAGGIIGDLSDGFNHLNSGDTLAANPRVFKAMSKRIKQCT